MKTSLSLLLLAAATAVAQPPPGDHPSDASRIEVTSNQVRTGGPLARLTPPQPISGPIVQAAKTGRPWQLFDVTAPAEVGNGWDNVIIDPVRGTAQGIKLFSINW